MGFIALSCSLSFPSTAYDCSIPDKTTTIKNFIIIHGQAPETSFELPHDKTNRMACAPSADSDQPGHPLSLIVFTVHMEKPWGLSYPMSAVMTVQPGLIWGFAVRTGHIVGFVMWRLILCLRTISHKKTVETEHSKTSKSPWLPVWMQKLLGVFNGCTSFWRFWLCLGSTLPISQPYMWSLSIWHKPSDMASPFTPSRRGSKNPDIYEFRFFAFAKS